MGGEELAQTFKSLQIFAKLLDLLAESAAQFSLELKGVETQAQGRQINFQQLLNHVQLLKTTPCFNYPGSAATAASLDSLSHLVGAQFN